MKYIKFAALTALAGLGLSACSGETTESSEGNKVSFALSTPEGVEFSSVTYDLDLQSGTQVKTGSIPVPKDDSVINGFIGALAAPADYSLTFAATGTYNGDPVTCSTASASTFSLTPGENEVLSPNPVLVCTVTTEIGQSIGNVTFTVDVEVEEFQVVVGALETFTVAPTTAAVDNVGGTCDWAPISIDVDDPADGVSITWGATPDGTFTWSTTNIDGTYNCSSPGSKTLRVTATYNSTSAFIDVPVICNNADCGVAPPTCGDGNIDTGLNEECDDSLEGCNDCLVTCGDGERYNPPTSSPAFGEAEQCDDGNLTNGDGCDSSCVVEPEFSCDAPLIECPAGSETCVDPNTDEANCGACGNACASGETCEAGVCEAGEIPLLEQCLTCIAGIPDIGQFNTDYCDSDPLCVATRNCVIESPSACYAPVPSDCFCGEGVAGDTCRAPSYTAVGACVDDIRAGSAAGLTNAQMLEEYYSFDSASGTAMNIVEYARTLGCAASCAL